MSDSLLSTPVVLNRADGSSRTFQLLSPAARMQYRAVFRTYRKMWLLETLRLIGIEGKDAIPHCNELDGKRVRESHVIEWLNEPEGQNEAILLSLRMDNPKATMDDVYALDLDDDERLNVGAGVLRIRVGPAKGGQAAGTDPLAASGGIGTTAATPISSADSAESQTPSPSPSTSSTPASQTLSTSAA